MNWPTSKNKLLILFISVIVLGIAIPGCSQIPEDWGTPNPDYLALVDKASCWHGICPGQTTREEAEGILQSLTLKGAGGIEAIESRDRWILPLDSNRFEESKVIVIFEDSGDLVQVLEAFFHPWPGFNRSVPSFLDYARYRP